MSSDFTVKLQELFKGNKTFEGIKDSDNNIIEDVNVFECTTGEEKKLNEHLQNRDDFIKSLRGSFGEVEMSEEQIGKLYDMVSQLDGEDGMSEEELLYLAEMSGKYDDKAKVIDDKDILAMLDYFEEVTYDVATKDSDRLVQNDEGKTVIQCKDSDGVYSVVDRVFDLDAMGIRPYSKEYHKLVESLMDANPEVFGEAGSKEYNQRIYSDLKDDTQLNIPETFVYSKANSEPQKVVKKPEAKVTEDKPAEPTTYKISTTDSDRLVQNDAGETVIQCKESDGIYGVVDKAFDLDAMGIRPYSKEYHKLVESVMNANPEIFGEADSKPYNQRVYGDLKDDTQLRIPTEFTYEIDN